MDIQLLKALSDGTRLKIVQMLSRHAYCVHALSRKVVLSESAVSQHLKILRDAGLVEGVKYGYYTHYRLNRALISHLADQLNALASAVPPAYERASGCDAAGEVGCRTIYTGEEGRNAPC